MTFSTLYGSRIEKLLEYPDGEWDVWEMEIKGDEEIEGNVVRYMRGTPDQERATLQLNH